MTELVSEVKQRNILKRIFPEAWLQRFLARLSASETATGFGLAVVVGVTAGLGAVFLRWLIGFFSNGFFSGAKLLLGSITPYYIVLVPVVGGLLAGPLVYYFAREAKGHGVPEVMEAVARKGGRIRSRVAFTKILASALTIGSGGSAGSEGPIIQIGSSLGSTIAQAFRVPDEAIKTLVACGAAGGVSAIFNAPVAGAIFSLEIILGRVVTHRFGYVVISSVVADIVARAFLGNQPVFIVPEFGITSRWEFASFFILGILSALAAVAFIRVLYRAEDIFDAFKIPGFVKPAIGGLVVGLLALINVAVLGTGYDIISGVLTGQFTLGVLLVLFLLKMAATSMTLGSGGSGGIFAPSLFMGATLGTAVGNISQVLFPAYTGNPGSYGVVGMAAVFAGATRAPFSAILIIFEMTRNYAIILPLMLAVGVSTVLARVLKRETIYTLKLVRRGVDLSQDEVIDILRTISVGEVMTKNFPSVPGTMHIDELIRLFQKSGHHGFPVVDEKGFLAGVITLSDVERHLGTGENHLTVGDIATRSPYVAYPDQPLASVLRGEEEEYGHIPVVSREDRRRLIGVLRRRDIIHAYRQQVKKTAGQS